MYSLYNKNVDFSPPLLYTYSKGSSFSYYTSTLSYTLKLKSI